MPSISNIVRGENEMNTFNGVRPYVIQGRRHHWENTWTVFREFDTLEEARRAYDALPFKTNYRLAEAYIQVRYKPVT